MKIVMIVEDCRDKISPNCMGTFTRKVQRGRPQVNCDVCRATKAPGKVVAAKMALPSEAPIPREQTNVCPCGTEFTFVVKRGKKPSKCQACREGNKVYRMDDDGVMQEVAQEKLDRERALAREKAGRERAEHLFQMMQPLIRRSDAGTIGR